MSPGPEEALADRCWRLRSALNVLATAVYLHLDADAQAHPAQRMLPMQRTLLESGLRQAVEALRGDGPAAP